MSTLSNNNFSKIPILIIAFNRPKYIDRLIKKIEIVRPEKLYIAIDGPRENNNNDKYLCDEVKSIFEKKVNWKCSIKKKYEKTNLGTKEAVYSAIRWLFDNEEMGIILEDDIDPDFSFFKFSEELLLKYKHSSKIKMISGNNYFSDNKLISESYYFSQTPATHGWATWRRTWDEMDIEMLSWNKNKKFIFILLLFNFNLTRAHYFFKRFELSYKNLIDSWDYQFFYSIIIKKGFIIKPKRNLCKHIGWGPDSTRGKGPDDFPEIKREQINFPLSHPKKIYVNYEIDKMEDIKVRKLSFFNYFLYLLKKKLFKN
tara:strand:+ start:708 stop:1646 length:939 start_codon:yes stop_codon:yes gene_type:complete